MSAFDHPLVKAAGLELQPIGWRHHELIWNLDRPELDLRSPIRRMRIEPEWYKTAREEAMGPSAVPVFTTEERAELLCVLTRPIEEVEAALQSGREHFRAFACETVALKLTEVIAGQLTVECLDAYNTWLESVGPAAFT